MIDKIFAAKSIDDLKKIGSYREVRSLLQERLTKKLQIKARGWKDLYSIIELIKNLDIVSGVAPDKGIDTEPTDYFKSEADKIIYALVELSGEAQLNVLGINYSHFKDKKKAKQLRNNIVHIIHPDKCEHPKSQEAINRLTKLFREVLD